MGPPAIPTSWSKPGKGIDVLRITAQQRSDPAIARAVIKSVLAATPGDSRRSYLEFVEGDAEYLAQRYGDRWGITLFEWCVRLNVGWV